MITFGLIGAGWRSEFYLRIAALMPQIFSVSGIFIRNPEKHKEFSEKYDAPIFDNLNDLLNTDFDFIVSCVSKDSINETAQMLANKDIAVLTETPVTDGELTGRIQVAEQFHFMPQNQAYKAIINSGILGKVNQVQLSCCHDYHAASLIRFFLDIKEEKPHKTEIKLTDKLSRYNSRAGLINPTAVNSEQKIVVLDFGQKNAVYDFNYEQYFSDIRSSRIVIRGTNGEIANDTVTYLKDGLPHSFTINRSYIGKKENLDGFSLVNLSGNGQILFENPFMPARLSDEEIAIATCLVKMKEYVNSGEEFYSVKDAYTDYSMF
ncbi:MAG: Gfo/Idh/MocA family oxidoreductase, partial [Clostridia bacterium]|nr:Gfo/Idh/MocA family oxidoreductase [Clostridia bacterium]